MKKTILIALPFALLIAADSPDRVTAADMTAIKGFEAEFVTKAIEAEINRWADRASEVIAFVRLHKRVERPEQGWEVNARLRSGAYDGGTEYAEGGDRMRSSATITATYPLWDKKTRSDIEARRVQDEQALINTVSDYFALLAEIEGLEHERELLTLKERRNKVRQHEGVIYLDDRIENLEALAAIVRDLRLKYTDKTRKKEAVLTLVKPEKRAELERML